MREEPAKFGTRVHYCRCEVPAVIGAAREMFWAPYPSWKAWLRCGSRPGEPFSLVFRIGGREVFRGRDPDVARLVVAFQQFLDENVDRVDRRGFRCVTHPPRKR